MATTFTVDLALSNYNSNVSLPSLGIRASLGRVPLPSMLRKLRRVTLGPRARPVGRTRRKMCTLRARSSFGQVEMGLGLSRSPAKGSNRDP